METEKESNEATHLLPLSPSQGRSSLPADQRTAALPRNLRTLPLDGRTRERASSKAWGWTSTCLRQAPIKLRHLVLSTPQRQGERAWIRMKLSFVLCSLPKREDSFSWFRRFLLFPSFSCTVFLQFFFPKKFLFFIRSLLFIYLIFIFLFPPLIHFLLIKRGQW